MSIVNRRIACRNLVLLACILVCTARAADLRSQTIYVKILVDEEEPTTRQSWQQRLAERVRQASDVISRDCPLEFAATCYDTWDSDDRLTDLRQTMREFEREASPSPAHIAIGFTSQYRFTRGRHSLGGTRGPMHSHILIREGARTIYEPERVEALVHEIGHFLGAVHTSDPRSAMRPVVGDGLARSRSFRIGFDPDNARVIRLVAREIRERRVRRFQDLSPETKRQIHGHYLRLAEQTPKDSTAQRYISLLSPDVKSAR